MELTIDTGIKQWFSNGFKSKQEVEEDKQKAFEDYNESRRATGKKPVRWEVLYDEKEKTTQTKA